MPSNRSKPPSLRPKRLRPAAVLALACLVAPAFAAAPKPATSQAAAQASGPAAVVRASSQKILDELKANEAKLKGNPALTRKLIKKYLLPHLAFGITSQAVLGRYWRSATPAQRKAFKQGFLHYLIATYSKGVAHYHGAKVKVLPFRGDKSKKYVRVRSRVLPSGHKPIEVDYAMVHTDSGWKVFDVIIAGVSYVKTYQSEFHAEVRRTSLAALIKRLQHTRAPKTLTAMKARAPGTGE